MKTIIKSIEEFFVTEGWRIHQIGDEPAYSMTFKGSRSEWVCIAQAFEDDRRFVFYSACPVKAPSESYPAVAELINRINYCLVYGNFELGYFDGQVRFRTSIEVPTQDLEPLFADRVVYSNVATMDMYLPAILDVIQKNASPMEAISRALQN